MAHFAKLDDNNIVEQVIVVSNDDTSDANGNESEEIGIAFCKKLFGADTKWKQTSYNNNFRVRYAGIGYTYNEELDAFIPPQPYPSWNLDSEIANWAPPVPQPTLSGKQIQDGYSYRWDEENTTWVLEHFANNTSN